MLGGKTPIQFTVTSDRSVLINFDSFQYSNCISWKQNGNFSDVLPSELPISVLKFINEVGLVIK